MKFFSIFAILAAALVATCASHVETNAVRLARGLPPLPPHRRSTAVAAARRGAPSGTPGGSCNTGPIHCCNSVTRANDSSMSTLLGLLGLVLDPTVLVGTQCSPISALGLGGNSCTQQPVCCENNNYKGLIVIGCSPITF